PIRYGILFTQRELWERAEERSCPSFSRFKGGDIIVPIGSLFFCIYHPKDKTILSWHHYLFEILTLTCTPAYQLTALSLPHITAFI
ncbi:hypothetical protein, partial [Porphyromonas sp.]|uniref:hypothetical protein n=1 Tax=Porphyromonas sp. TaxID=1924944 RepID=UPI002579CC76